MVWKKALKLEYILVRVVAIFGCRTKKLIHIFKKMDLYCPELMDIWNKISLQNYYLKGNTILVLGRNTYKQKSIPLKIYLLEHVIDDIFC